MRCCGPRQCAAMPRLDVVHKVAAAALQRCQVVSQRHCPVHSQPASTTHYQTQVCPPRSPPYFHCKRWPYDLPGLSMPSLSPWRSRLSSRVGSHRTPAAGQHLLPATQPSTKGTCQIHWAVLDSSPYIRRTQICLDHPHALGFSCVFINC